MDKVTLKKYLPKTTGYIEDSDNGFSDVRKAIHYTVVHTIVCKSKIVFSDEGQNATDRLDYFLRKYLTGVDRLTHSK